MTTEEIIAEVKQTGNLSPTTIQQIEDDKVLRFDLVNHFKTNHDRDFALKFLKITSDLRRTSTVGISGDSLMLACYIVGNHKQIEDCMRVWGTKCLDFDTYCYVDIQLVVFAGVQETIAYLKTQTSTESTQALEYVVACSKAGDFDDLEKYFTDTPWYI